MIYLMKESKSIKSRKFNKILILILMVFLLFSLSSCRNQTTTNQTIVSTYDYTVFPEQMKGIIKDKNIYLTSIGQSSDMADFRDVILSSLGLFEYACDSFLDINSVKEGSVVLLFAGCSIKALAASEVTVDEELSRAKGFSDASIAKKITLICFHTGGEARRGSTSDLFINATFKYSTFNVFTISSNNDSLISNISSENNILCYEIINFLELEKTIKLLYGEASK